MRCEIAEAERVIAAALAGRPGVVSVYLFGSVPDGPAHRDSDIDVAVLLERTRFPTAGERFAERLALIAAIGGALGRDDVDLVVLNDAPPGRARAIVGARPALLAHDASADHAFRRTTLSRAADLEPFLRRTRRVKLAALARPAGSDR